MLRLEDIRKNGLVHWGGVKEVKWNCLGEKEEPQTRSDWRNDWMMVEGVGSRTRAASRGGYFEENAGAGVKDSEVLITETAGDDDIYDFDEGDEGIKKQTRNISKKINLFMDESEDDHDEDDGWLEKPKKGKGKKGKGRGKGRGRRLGGINGRLGKNCDLLSNPGVDTFSGAVDEHSQEKVAKYAPIIVAKNDDKITATVSPTTAMCNRFLLGTGEGEYSRTSTEMRGGEPALCAVWRWE
jgi:hypothetical protein